MNNLCMLFMDGSLALERTELSLVKHPCVITRSLLQLVMTESKGP